MSPPTKERRDRRVRFLRKRKVPILRSPFVPRGAGEAFRDLMVDAHDMENVVHPALTGNHLSYVSFAPFFGAPELMKAGARQLGLRIAGVGCQAARSYAAVSTEGEVAPCVQLLDSSCVCGNVRQEPASACVTRELVPVGRERVNAIGRNVHDFDVTQ